MRRAAALAVLAALLVVLAPVAVLADHSQRAVASQHTDFGTGIEPSPDTLTNMSVEGSGDSASVVLETRTITVDQTTFDSPNSQNSYTVPSDADRLEITVRGGSGGDGGGLAAAAGGAGGSVSGSLPVSGGSTFTVHVGENGTDGSADSGGAPGGAGGQSPLADGGDGGPSSDGTTGSGGGGGAPSAVVRDSDGEQIAVGEGGGGGQGGANFDSSNAGGGGGGGARGGSGGGGGSAGSAGQDAGGTGNGGDGGGGTSGTGEGAPGESGGTATHGDLQSVSTGSSDAGPVVEITATREQAKSSGAYLGANHNVSQAREIKVNMTLQNASADVSFIDPTKSGFAALLNTSTFSTTGNHSLTVSEGTHTSDKVQVGVEITTQSGPTVAEIHDESVLFDAESPSVDAASASPTGQISSVNPTLSIDVNDSDFPLAQGDSVTAEFFVDGTSQGTDTLTSNGTASVTASGLTGGSHTWNVTVTDSHGLSHTSQDFTIEVPDELRIENETNPGTLIDDREVDLTIYINGTEDPHDIVSRTTNDGTVDMAGLPAGESMVVVASADGYLDRRVFIESLYQTQTLYLLNDSTVTHTDVIFRVEDYSGRFPPGRTVLKVQRGLQGNYTTILGDYFGANDQFTAEIEFNTRHRLILMNTETGDERLLGTYTPLTSGTETLTISPDGGIDVTDRQAVVSLSPSAQTLPDEAGVFVNATAANGTDPLTSWELNIYHLNGSNTTLFSDSSALATGGTLAAKLNLSDKAGRIKAITRYSTASGTTSDVSIYNITTGPSHSMTLLDGLAAVVALVPTENTDTVTTLTALVGIVGGTAALGSVFRLGSEGMGLVVLSLTAGFAIIGWVPYTLLFSLVVVGAALTFLRRRY